MKNLLTILLFISFTANATNYYISSSGNDANNGTSTSTPWQTIAKINSSTFSAGDEILFNDGGTWFGPLIVSSNGTSGSPITFGSYGTGAKPIITTYDSLLNAKNPATWFQRGTTNIWSHAYSGFMNFLQRMWFDGIEYGIATNANSITSTWRWYFTTAAVDSISVYATSNPATFYSSIYIPSSEVGGAGATSTLSLTDKDWITFDGIDFQGGGYETILLMGADHIVFQNCNIGRYCNNEGLFTSNGGVDKSSDSCIVYNCIIDAAATINYPDQARDNTGAYDALCLEKGASGWEISYNTFTGWLHGGVTLLSDDSTKVVRNNYIHHNTFDGGVISYARGFETAGKYLGCVSNNIFAYNTCINMKVGNQFGGDSNLVYFNVFNGMTDPNARGSAIGINPASFGSGTYICKWNKFYNNTIYNAVNNGIRISGFLADSLVADNEIINNIIVGGSDWGFYMDDRVFFRRTTIKNNIFYKSGLANFIDYHLTAISVATLNTQTTNQDVISGNIAVDPLFISNGTNFNLQSTSPAINAGIYVGLPYSGSAPDIGAYEYSTSATFKIKRKVKTY